MVHTTLSREIGFIVLTILTTSLTLQLAADTSSETRDLCLGTRALIISSRGTGADLIPGHTGVSLDTDDKQAY